MRGIGIGEFFDTRGSAFLHPVAEVRVDTQGQKLEDFPNVLRWFNAINNREQVQAGLAVLADDEMATNLSASQRASMFAKDGPKEV